jgi:hypothetical protein
MKKLKIVSGRFTFIFSLIILFATTCKKENKIYYAIEGDKLSGTINGITTGDIDYVVAYLEDTEQYIVGADSVNTTNFSVELVTPPDQFMQKYTSDSGIVISDTSVRYCNLYIECFKNGNLVGSLVRLSSNYVLFTLTLQKGDVICNFIYVDKKVSITGQTFENDAFLARDMVTNYNNLSFKAGWNEIILKCEEVEVDSYTFSTASNNEPGGIEWYLLVPVD